MVSHPRGLIILFFAGGLLGRSREKMGVSGRGVMGWGGLWCTGRLVEIGLVIINLK